MRPDGYLGFRCALADATQITDWLALLTIQTQGLTPAQLEP